VFKLKGHGWLALVALSFIDSAAEVKGTGSSTGFWKGRVEPVLNGGFAEPVCGVVFPKTFRGRFHAPLRLGAGVVVVGTVNDIVLLAGPAFMSRPTNKGGRLALVTGGRLVIVMLCGRVDDVSVCTVLSKCG
jgi:hypothetical protein